jgi:hypothetical protein
MDGIKWDKATHDKFKQAIGTMPFFQRSIAEKMVSEKAESVVRKENRQEVTEKDMVDAFFVETPFGFQGLMKNMLTEIGIDYTKYGYEK